MKASPRKFSTNANVQKFAGFGLNRINPKQVSVSDKREIGASKFPGFGLDYDRKVNGSDITGQRGVSDLNRKRKATYQKPKKVTYNRRRLVVNPLASLFKRR